MKLVEATEAQQVERDRLTAEVWGDQLSLEQYLERERILRRHEFALDRSGYYTMKTWLLQDDDLGVLASCETYCIEGAHRQPAVDEKWILGPTRAIASVWI